MAEKKISRKKQNPTVRQKKSTSFTTVFTDDNPFTKQPFAQKRSTTSNTVFSEHTDIGKEAVGQKTSATSKCTVFSDNDDVRKQAVYPKSDAVGQEAVDPKSSKTVFPDFDEMEKEAVGEKSHATSNTFFPDDDDMGKQNVGQKSRTTSSSKHDQPRKRSSSDLIAYIHNVSPVKRNKRNTIDYCELTLQTEKETQKAICFSKCKRRILLDRETDRTPVKISNYTKTADGEGNMSKMVINDMTKVAVAESSEYCFQYKNFDNQPPVVSLEDVVQVCSPMDVVTVSGKLLSKSNTEIVGKDSLKLAKAILSDGTTAVKLELWEHLIDKVEEGRAYTLTSVRVREWDGKRKLSTTKECLITQNNDENLKTVSFDPSSQDNPLEDPNETIKVSNLYSVEDIQKFKQCINCSRKILQVDSGLTLYCDRCGHSARAADCKTKVCAKVVINQELDGKNNFLHLTLFQNVLEKIMTIDDDNIDKQSIGENLLLMDNVTLTYNRSNNIVNAIHFAD